jgi:hypothetical protein
MLETETLVKRSVDGILMLEQAGQLIGDSLRMDGLERAMLVGAIRAKAGGDLNECQLHALADFIPIAFARIAFSDTGIKFPDYFGRRDSSGRIRDYRRLDEEPVYNEALNIARAWWKSRPEDVKTIADWSGTSTTVKNAIAKGSKLEDLEVAPTLLNGPDEACSPISERPTFHDNPWWLKHWIPRPWWKFW